MRRPSRSLNRFRANRRGYWSMCLFLAVLVLSLLAPLIANDRPLLVRYNGHLFFPIVRDYAETDFGGEFATDADFRDPFIAGQIAKHGWMLTTPIPYGPSTVNFKVVPPSPPTSEDWLGTDDQGRDVMARLLYGMRVSLVFGFLLTVSSSIIGIAAGAVQGYFGGLVDLSMQRFIEIWGGMPQLYLLLIMGSIITPGFFSLLGLLLLFSWMQLVQYVRAEFLRARNFDFVKAARAMGVSDAMIIRRHILPNALVATLTFLPFIMTGGISALTALDFLGFGMPPGSPSLGEMVAQAKTNLNAWWLAAVVFVAIGGVLSLLTFIGEAVREAFDPRHADSLPSSSVEQTT
jgi:microcin C transport system permease protein